MTPTQIRKAKAAYFDMFYDDMSPEAIEIAKKVKTVDDLYTYPNDDVLSNGELDCLEAVL